MTPDGWLETYRGTVFRWEVDNNDHLTVAYYFARFADAGLTLLHALGLGRPYTEREGRACLTVDCHVRYLREFRVGALLHVASGVIAVEGDGLLLGHKVFDSEDGSLCTTVEQRLLHVAAGRAPVPLPDEAQRAARARRVAWGGPPRERRVRPRGLEGFDESARDTVKPGELDVFGELALPAFIHRFSAANGHAVAAFGLTPGYMREARRGFSTFEFQLAFAGEARPGDPVAVRSALVHVGNSSLRILHVMVNERSGERVAALEQSGVHLDLDARRPAPLPDALRERARARLVPPREG